MRGISYIWGTAKWLFGYGTEQATPTPTYSKQVERNLTSYQQIKGFSDELERKTPSDLKQEFNDFHALLFVLTNRIDPEQINKYPYNYHKNSVLKPDTEYTINAYNLLVFYKKLDATIHDFLKSHPGYLFINIALNIQGIVKNQIAKLTRDIAPDRSLIRFLDLISDDDKTKTEKMARLANDDFGFISRIFNDLHEPYFTEDERTTYLNQYLVLCASVRFDTKTRRNVDLTKHDITYLCADQFQLTDASQREIDAWINPILAQGCKELFTADGNIKQEIIALLHLNPQQFPGKLTKIREQLLSNYYNLVASSFLTLCQSNSSDANQIIWGIVNKACKKPNFYINHFSKPLPVILKNAEKYFDAGQKEDALQQYSLAASIDTDFATIIPYCLQLTGNVRSKKYKDTIETRLKSTAPEVVMLEYYAKAKALKASASQLATKSAVFSTSVSLSAPQNAPRNSLRSVRA